MVVVSGAAAQRPSLTVQRHVAIVKVQLALCERLQNVRRQELNGAHGDRCVLRWADRTEVTAGQATGRADQQAGDETVDNGGWHVGG